MHNGILALGAYKERVGTDKIIEGWVEGPIAQAADLRGINQLMLDFYDDPGFVRDLFAFVTEMELRFAREQIRAGADVMGIGDAAASLVRADIYEEFVWPYEKHLVDGLHALGTKVRLHICGDIRRLLPGIARLGCDLVEIDSMVPVAQAREVLGPQPVLIGNLSPVAVVRDAQDPALVQEAIAQCHREAGERFIVGAGCEIPRDSPHQNLRALADYAHQTRP